MRDIIGELTIEYKELNKKLINLIMFTNSEKFNLLSKEHQNLLLTQQSLMQRYSETLTDRIKLLEKEL